MPKKKHAAQKIEANVATQAQSVPLPTPGQLKAQAEFLFKYDTGFHDEYCQMISGKNLEYSLKQAFIKQDYSLFGKICDGVVRDMGKTVDESFIAWFLEAGNKKVINAIHKICPQESYKTLRKLAEESVTPQERYQFEAHKWTKACQNIRMDNMQSITKEIGEKGIAALKHKLLFRPPLGISARVWKMQISVLEQECETHLAHEYDNLVRDQIEGWQKELDEGWYYFCKGMYSNGFEEKYQCLEKSLELYMKYDPSKYDATQTTLVAWGLRYLYTTFNSPEKRVLEKLESLVSQHKTPGTLENLLIAYANSYNRLKNTTRYVEAEELLKKATRLCEENGERIEEKLIRAHNQNVVDYHISIEEFEKAEEALAKCNPHDLLLTIRRFAGAKGINCINKTLEEISGEIIKFALAGGQRDINNEVIKPIFGGRALDSDVLNGSLVLFKKYLQCIVAADQCDDYTLEAIKGYYALCPYSKSLVDAELIYAELVVYSKLHKLDEASEKIAQLRNFYDLSGQYERLIPLNLIQQAHKIHFFNCIEVGNIDEAEKCLGYVDLASTAQLIELLNQYREKFVAADSSLAGSVDRVEEEDAISEVASERQTQEISASSRLEEASSGKERKEHVVPQSFKRPQVSRLEEGVLTDDTVRAKLSSGVFTIQEWVKCLGYLKNRTIDENPESWVIGGKVYDLAHGVVNLHEVQGYFANMYVYIAPKVLKGLDSVMVSKFTRAAESSVLRIYGQNGLKPVDGIVEIKVSGVDIRLCANKMYINTLGKKLLMFDHKPDNHAAVASKASKEEMKEFYKIPIDVKHHTIDELLEEYNLAGDLNFCSSDASSEEEECTTLQDTTSMFDSPDLI